LAHQPPSGKKKTLFAWDSLGDSARKSDQYGPSAAKDFDELYVANLARTTITRAKNSAKRYAISEPKTSCD